MATKIPVGGELESRAVGGILADSEAVLDRSRGLHQRAVNDLLERMMSNAGLSNIGVIGSVSEVADATYALGMNGLSVVGWESFEPDDIVFSINPSDSSVSWMRIVSKNVQEGRLTVVLYPDADVPGGLNHAPAAGCMLTRRGNASIPADGEVNERAQSWIISSDEGRIMFLANVYKPILEDYNYALTLGKLPDLAVLQKLPVSAGDIGLVAKTIIAESVYQFDYNGDVVARRIDRGAWSLSVAEGLSPYRMVSSPADGVTVLEQHTVYHYGCKWGCISDKTTDEPKWNSQGWILLEGDGGYSLSFDSSNGWQFFRNNVDTVITALVSYGNRDITVELMALSGVEVEWLRDTGDAVIDAAWSPEHVGDSRHVIRLRAEDMGAGWGEQYRKIRFTCRIFIPVGEAYESIESSITYKI